MLKKIAFLKGNKKVKGISYKIIIKKNTEH